MGTPYTDVQSWIVGIAMNLVSAAIGAITMFFFRKKYGRKIIRFVKWIRNDILTIDLLAVRNYPYVDVKDIDVTTFDYIKSRISEEIKYVSHNPNGMIIRLPLFGNLIVSIQKFPIPIEDEEIETYEALKLSVRSELPIRVGSRELNKLEDFEKHSNVIFDIIENKLFVKEEQLKDNFAVCDVSRTKYLVENSNLEFKDIELSAVITTTDSKVSIKTPIDKITEATERYYFS
jgi:hypothetical protein